MTKPRTRRPTQPDTVTVTLTRPITLVAQPGAGHYQPGEHTVTPDIAARLTALT